MGEVDARNMYNDFAVNKYPHTVASCWISLTQSYDKQNHEYKCYLISVSILIMRVFWIEVKRNLLQSCYFNSCDLRCQYSIPYNTDIVFVLPSILPGTFQSAHRIGL